MFSQIPILSRMLPPYTGSSADTVFGFHIYGEHSEKRWFIPIRFWHDHVLRRIDKVYYWFHGRFVMRFHIVKTDLTPGWCDVDEVMFRACFALLGRFVEYELGIARVDDESQYRGYRLHSAGGSDEAAIDLWRWYRDDLRRLQDDEWRDWQAFHDRHGFDYIEKLKDEKLDELMRMRHTLWT